MSAGEIECVALGFSIGELRPMRSKDQPATRLQMIENLSPYS